jgi:nitroreductase
MAGTDLLTLMRERRSRPALVAPGPDATQLRELLVAASTAPDHGRLRPWRFIVVDGPARERLGEAFAAATGERNAAAGSAELARARTKPLRAPLIVVVVATPRPHPRVSMREQRAAAACVAHGLVLAAHASGVGAMWRSGWYGDAPAVRGHLGLADAEELTGFIYLGTPSGPAPAPRAPVEPPVTWLS